MKKINLLNIGARLMHVVTSSQIIFYTHLYFNILIKVGVYWNICQGYGCSVHNAESIWTMHNLDISKAIRKIV